MKKIQKLFHDNKDWMLYTRQDLVRFATYAALMTPEPNSTQMIAAGLVGCTLACMHKLAIGFNREIALYNHKENADKHVVKTILPDIEHDMFKTALQEKATKQQGLETCLSVAGAVLCMTASHHKTELESLVSSVIDNKQMADSAMDHMTSLARTLCVFPFTKDLGKYGGDTARMQVSQKKAEVS